VKARLPLRGEFEGEAEPPLMKDKSGAFGQDSRCDAGLVFCLVATVQAARGSSFDTPFGQAIHCAFVPERLIYPP